MNGREIRIPSQNMAKVETTTAQLTPDYLDSIINNPNEHPQIKKQAEQMKKNLFSQAEEPAAPTPEPTETPKKVSAKKAKKDITEQDFIIEQSIKSQEKPIQSAPKQVKIEQQEAAKLQAQPISNPAFDLFLSDFKNTLFTDEFSIPSSPDTKVQIRSMTVSEYKFLSKQFEIYQKSLEAINKDEKNIEDASRQSDIREAILTNAIDTVLQRCITNNIRVYDLTLFDWVYAILIVRAISRGTEENLRVRCTNPDCRNSVRLGVADLLHKIETNKDKFIVNPLGIIPIKEGVDLYLGLPTRGDLVEAQKILLADNETGLNFVNMAMFIKAYISNNVANLLNPQQRFSLLNALPYDVVRQIRDKVNENFKSFYDCFGEIKCEACQKIMEIDVSDFILFFYDF